MKEFSPEYEVMSWEMMIVTYTYRRYLLPDPCFVTGVIRPFISSRVHLSRYHSAPLGQAQFIPFSHVANVVTLG